MVFAVATHPPVGAQVTCALNPFLSSAIVKFMDQEWECGQTLPKVQEAEIDARKFEQYSLNPENPNNQGKWMAFVAIGYDVNSPQGRQIATEDIIEQLRTKLPKSKDSGQDFDKEQFSSSLTT